LVVHQFRRAQDGGLAKTLAWIVMPDHFHWLVELENCSLRKLMRQTKSLITREVNLSSSRSGPLWQQGYHDRALRREEDLVSWPGMSWQIHCGPDLLKNLATIRCGMLSGFESAPSCLHRWQASSHRDLCRSRILNSTQKPVGAGLPAMATPRSFSPAHTPSTPTG
jgi:hypothetical protein